MATFKKFEDVMAWQKARGVCCEIYRISRSSPIKQDFELNNQIRRAAISIMSNMAEGYGRSSPRDFAHLFLDNARGLATKAQSLLYVALDAGYINQRDSSLLFQQSNETIAPIAGLTAYLRGKHSGNARTAATTSNSEPRTENP